MASPVSEVENPPLKTSSNTHEALKHNIPPPLQLPEYKITTTMLEKFPRCKVSLREQDTAPTRTGAGSNEFLRGDDLMWTLNKLAMCWCGSGRYPQVVLQMNMLCPGRNMSYSSCGHPVTRYPVVARGGLHHQTYPCGHSDNTQCI